MKKFKLLWMFLLVILNSSFSISTSLSKRDMKKLNDAVQSGSERKVKSILGSKPGYNLNTLDDEGYGAIHFALNSQNPVNMMKLLLEKGADINLRTPDESTVLHLAIRMQKPDLRDFLLSKQECEIDPMDDVAMTPLFYAIDNKDEMGVKGLLNRGASCLMKDLAEESPIHFAVKSAEDSTKILELVLKNGGAETVNEENEFGRTSLHTAALFPTNKNKEVLKLLLDNGADKEYLDKNDFTPEALAEEKGYFATAEFIKFYQKEQTVKGPIGKLPDLKEKASDSASKIQAYVNYVLGLTPYTSLADKKVAKTGKKFGWKAKFGELDNHLEKAKEHAVSWNVLVYPSMRSLFGDLDAFSQKYINGYLKNEPNLKALKHQKVDQSVIDEELANSDEMWIERNYDVVRRKFLKRRLEKKLKNEQLKYDNGLIQIKDFFDYILTFAKEYKAASHVTVEKLGVFLKNITEDKANFESDYKWLNTTAVTMSAKEFEQLTYISAK